MFGLGIGQSLMLFSVSLLFMFCHHFHLENTSDRKVNMKWGCAGILHLPAGNPCLFEGSLCYFTLRGWEHVQFERTLAVYQRVLLLEPSLFFCLETWVLIVSGGNRIKSWGDLCARSPTYYFIQNGSQCFRSLCQNLVSQVHFVSAPMTLVHVAQFCLLSRRAEPSRALALCSLSLTDLIIEVTRRSGWFPVRWWQDAVLLMPRTSSGSPLKGSYCHPCPHLPQQSSSSTSTANFKILSPTVSWIMRDDSIFTYRENGDLKFPPGFSTVIRLLSSHAECCWRV